MKLNNLLEALEELKKGKFILVCDDAKRENEADLLMAAEFVTPSHVNFMINNGRGLICVPLTQEIATKLELPLMIENHSGSMETAFTVSVDLLKGTHTGISSRDRALTINALGNKKSLPHDFARPGHVFPLIAWDEGVLKRAGHTEAAVDLMKLAKLNPVGVLCETLNEEGVPLKGKELLDFSKKFQIMIVSIEEIISHKLFK